MNINIQVPSQELKHHCCLPDLKDKTVMFVKMRVIQISSGTKNPRNGKLNKASLLTNYQKNQDKSLKKQPNYLGCLASFRKTEAFEIYNFLFYIIFFLAVSTHNIARCDRRQGKFDVVQYKCPPTCRSKAVPVQIA